MCRSRFWSCFRNLSDAELEEGITQLKREHANSENLIFPDRIIFLVCTVLCESDRAACDSIRGFKAVEDFSLNGFAYPIKLACEEMAGLAEHYQKFIGALKDGGCNGDAATVAQLPPVNVNSHLVLSWLHRYIFKNDKLKILARTLLGTDDIVVLSTEWQTRFPSVSWQQDCALLGCGQNGISLWLAFTDVPAGLMQLKRGSQKLGQTQDEQTWNNLEDCSPQMACGEACVRNFCTVHRTVDNADISCVGLVIHLLPADCVPNGPRRRVTMLCGDEMCATGFELVGSQEPSEESGFSGYPSSAK